MRRLRFVPLLLLICTRLWAAGLTFTGFENQTSDDYATSGTASYVTTQHHGGAASVEVNPSGAATGSILVSAYLAAGNRTLGAINTATLFADFYFRYHTKPASGDEEICQFQATTTVALKAAIRINSSGDLSFYDSTLTKQGSDGTTALAVDTWYRIEAKCGTSASTAAWAIWINGTPEISGASANTTSTNCGPLALGKVTNRNGNTVDFFYDDCWLDDSAFVGAHQVALLKTRANGTNQTSTIGGTSPAATHWQSVNDVPNDTTTTYLISSSTSGDKETELFDSSATGGVSGTINGVREFLWVRNDAGGASNGNVLVTLISGGTASSTTGTATSSSFTGRSKLYLTDPHTSGGWTTGALDAIEAGYTQNIATNTVDVTTVQIYVDYSTGGPPAGMAIWYRNGTGIYKDTAETQPATTTSDAVKAWADSSGNARDCLLTSVNNPVLATSDVNGKTAVNFSASGSTLRVTYAYGRTFDVYMLVKQTGWESGAGILQDNSGTHWAFEQRISGGASPEVDWWDGGAATHLGSSLTLNTYFVVVLSAKGSGAIGSWQVNTGSETNVANPMTNGNPTTLDFGVEGSSGTGKFKCVELILYTSNLGSTDRTNTVNYLMTLGGLSSSTPSSTSLTLTGVGFNPLFHPREHARLTWN